MAANLGLVSTQSNADTEIGNVNLLIGTNKGMTGWSAPSSLILSETSESIYTDLDTTNYLTISCNTSGNVWAAFSSENLRKVLAQETEGSSYTLSLDIRQSSIFSIPGLGAFFFILPGILRKKFLHFSPFRSIIS